MTEQPQIIPPAPSIPDTCLGFEAQAYATAPCGRHDGWTPERQCKFLQMLAEGTSVKKAAFFMGMSVQSAYALRRSARGAAFALGWNAAQLLGRDALADEMMGRAMHGTMETIVTPEGHTVDRFRHDNRLAMAVLTRLDKLADNHTETSHAAARLVAAEFGQFLDMIGRDAGPARAGLFLGARLGTEGSAPAPADDLAPIRALARADHWLRTHTDAGAPIDTADLDPAQRAEWSAEQWARAEAAGLLQLAPPAPAPQASPLPASAPATEPLPALDELAPYPKLRKVLEGDELTSPVWIDDEDGEARTSFPPPPGFDGDEEGEYGQEGYNRTLSPAEHAVIDAEYGGLVAARRGAEMLERDAWFGFTPENVAEDCEAPEEADAPGPGTDTDDHGEIAPQAERNPGWVMPWV